MWRACLGRSYFGPSISRIGNASMRGRAECCAFGILLQICAWDHVHIGRPDRVRAPSDLHDCSLGSRWNMRLRFRKNVRATDIKFYRDELDHNWSLKYVDTMRHTVKSLGHLMDDPAEPSGLMDALGHIKWDIENVLERLPTLAASGYSYHRESPPYFYHQDDIPSTSTPAYDFPFASVPIHPSDVPLTLDVLHFDFQLASTSQVHQFDTSFTPIPQSDIPSTSEVHPVDITYRRRLRRHDHISTEPVPETQKGIQSSVVDTQRTDVVVKDISIEYIDQIHVIEPIQLEMEDDVPIRALGRRRGRGGKRGQWRGRGE